MMRRVGFRAVEFASARRRWILLATALLSATALLPVDLTKAQNGGSMLAPPPPQVLLGLLNTWTQQQNLNGGINLDAATAPDLSDQKGTAQNFFGTCCGTTVFTGGQWNLSIGTAVLPYTANGPAIKISQTRQFPNTNCGANVSDSSCSTAVDVSVVCGVSDAENCNGTTSDVVVQSTIAPGGNGQGMVGRCDIVGSSGNVARAGCEGGFFAARADGSFVAVPSSAYLAAIEVSPQNFTASNAPAVDGTSSGGYNGIAINARGNGNLVSSGIEIEQVTSQFQDGISNKILGGSSETVDFLKDYASEPTLLVDVGSHTSGYDANGATYSGFFLRSPSAGFTVDGSGNAVALTSTVSGNISLPAYTTSGARFVLSPATITDTTSSGTVANDYVSRFAAQILAASSATTYTTAASLEIPAPTAGTNVTITNPVALQLDGQLKATLGASIFGGNITLNGSSNFNVNGCTGTCTGQVNFGNANASSVTLAGPVFINNSVNSGVTICGGTCTGTVAIGNANDTVNLAPATLQIGGTAGVTSATCTQWTKGLCTHV